jgi:hypothetical protein
MAACERVETGRTEPAHLDSGLSKLSSAESNQQRYQSGPGRSLQAYRLNIYKVPIAHLDFPATGKKETNVS